MADVNTGFFGGSFDPIHFGHLTMAVELMETHHLDEVWFCPARISPHKLDDHPVAVEHRLEMVKIAVEGIPQFRVIEYEAFREGPSFTVDTLETLKAQEPDRRFFLMLGDDSIQALPRWHRVQDLVAMAPLLVGKRVGGLDAAALRDYPELEGAVSRGLTNTSVVEVSATEIRQRIKDGRYCGHLVPAKVLDYIAEYRLYST